jgi:hypothetical protein
MKKSEIITILKMNEAQSWIVLQNLHQLEYDCAETGVEFTGQKWVETCCNKWAVYSDLLKEIGVPCFTSNERDLLIIQNKLTK